MATAEESLGGEGTFEEDGKIFSSSAGPQVNDSRSHSVGVASEGEVRMLREGDLVYAMITDLFDMVAAVKFQPAEIRGVRIGASSNSAYLRIPEIQRGYTEQFRDFIRIGDVIRARVKEVKPLGIYLTMVDQDLGVIKAFCSQCRTQLELRGRLLSCPNCGNKESRKLAESRQ